MGKRITKAELKGCLRHYWRIRKWAKAQNPNDHPSSPLMFNSINEDYSGGSCVLCVSYTKRGCRFCPLNLNGHYCGKSNEPYKKMVYVKTWKGWIFYATKVAQTIMNLPRYPKKYI